ncbi:hypothetical protein [Paenibacillus amylolyticus]|uniref:hypothetical protein n=2 Tax=Paenibacillus TaxID=44249 RepID=UPI000B884BD7|nr:hypothetical protein [Paenibacillus amylolyticus]
MKMTRKKKIIFLITGIALLSFIVWNLVWFVFVSTIYTPFTKEVTKDKYGSHHIVDSDGYNYNVAMPIYLFFSGNLAVVAPEAKSTLIIWPKVFGGYEYGVRIQDASGGYEIMIDADGNPIRLPQQSNKEFDTLVSIIENNKKDVQEILKKAHNVWELN